MIDLTVRFMVFLLNLLATVALCGVQERTVFSPALARQESYTLIVPEGSRPRPLLVLLHGRGRNHRTLIDDAKSLDSLQSSEKVVLLPNGRDSWWTGPYENFVLELIDRVSADHAITEVTIGGWSMGGFGSLRIAVNHPNRFAGWFGILGLVDFPNASYPRQWNHEVPPVLSSEDNPFRNVEHLRGKRIRFVTADQAFDRKMNEALSAKLNAAGIAHTFEIFNGAHTFDIVRQALQPARIMKLERIWDQAPHNAFTDLVRFQGSWYCVFREGKAHVSPDGRLRVIRSRDGAGWQSAALLSSGKGDLRDAKIVVTPDGKLQLMGAAALHQPAPARHQSFTWFSENGSDWTEARAVADPDFWLWRITWFRDTAYGFGYNTSVNRNDRTLRFYISKDGRSFETAAADMGIKNSPGENAIRFQEDGTAICLLRRDPYTGQPSIAATDATALIGVAKHPYKEWKWQDTGTRVGGPNFILLPDGRRVAAVRLHDGKVRTSLCWLDETRGTLREFLVLPSSGDSSYAGLVWHNGNLHISYYSTHEGGKSAIYYGVVSLL